MPSSSGRQPSPVYRELKRFSMISFAGISFVGLIAWSPGCSQSCDGACHFYELPISRWSGELRKMAPSEQWRTYLYGMSHEKPPPVGLSVDVAASKSAVMPQLIAALRSNGPWEAASVSDVVQMMRAVFHYEPCSVPAFREQLTKTDLTRSPNVDALRC